MSKKVYFLYSPEFDGNAYPASSPFDTSRSQRTRDTISSMGLLGANGDREKAPVRATREELEAFHPPVYLDALLRAEDGHLDIDALRMGLGTPDCPIIKGIYDFVSMACGASITGARMLLDGEADIVFNPSGGFHHAGPDKASGFCYMNDVVLAAMTIAEGDRRTAVLDLDAHHCDGVQNAFYDRNDIMTISLHENGKTLFPGTGFEYETGTGPGGGYSVNIPLPAGTHDAAYKMAFREAALPQLLRFDPDVIIVELGMDSLADDPLTHLGLTNNTYADILETVIGLDKPLLATGGGGYHVENTVRGWALAWSVMCGEHEADMALGMGGVMLENTEWSAGLRDRELIADDEQRRFVDRELKKTLAKLKKQLSKHGI